MVILFSANVSISIGGVVCFSLTTTTAGSSAVAKVLISDLLAVHMVRAPTNSTLITIHPPRETRGTDAGTLHARLYYTGASAHWSKLYAQVTDPTFVIVTTLWHAFYAWDQALDILYEHIRSLVCHLPHYCS
jgi:hypothetical protein